MSVVWWGLTALADGPPAPQGGHVQVTTIPDPAPPTPEPGVAPIANVVQVVGQGVRVDWTTLRIEVETTTSGSAAQSRESVEQLARREVDAAFLQVAERVRVTSTARIGDLLADPSLGGAITSRLPRWGVDEVWYGTSGRIHVAASLPLQDLLKPWSMQIARAGAAPPAVADAPSGLLVEARGTGAEPAYAPRLLGDQGQLLYAAELYEEQAVTRAPYVFVSDPAHPAAAQAGPAPVWVKAVSAAGSDLTLDAAGTQRVAELLESLVGRGGIVVVIDPP